MKGWLGNKSNYKSVQRSGSKFSYTAKIVKNINQ